MSLATVSLATSSLGTISLGTMFLGTISLRTIVPRYNVPRNNVPHDNCSSRQFFLTTIVPRDNCFMQQLFLLTIGLRNNYSSVPLQMVIYKEDGPPDDQNQEDGGARIVANDHLDDPASSVLLRSFANGHLQRGRSSG